MPQASEFLALTPALLLWQAYDASVKSDLFATAVKTKAGIFFIDPILLEPRSLEELIGSNDVAAVLVTNSNHLRDARAFAGRFQAPVFGAAEVVAEFPAGLARPIGAEEIAPGVSAIALEGAAPGEVAFHFAEDGGTVVVGDALINFEPYGFTFLPAKYCTDQKTMKLSLRRLLDRPFERLFFAHGTPILAQARERLEMLLR